MRCGVARPILCPEHQHRQTANTMRIQKTHNNTHAALLLKIGLVLAVFAVGELVFDLSGTRAANSWKIESTKAKIKKNRRADVLV